MAPGPAPKHPSRRARRNSPGFSTLPAKGRTGEAPEWPLGPDAAMAAEIQMIGDKLAALAAELETEADGRKRGRIKRSIDQLTLTCSVLRLRMEQAGDAEGALWAELWTTPQAVMWDESSAFARMVAVFVRWHIRAEQGDLKAATEARLRSQELGLTPLSLMRLRREVEEANAAEARGDRRRRGPDKPPEDGDSKPAEGDDPRGGLYVVS